MSFHLQSGPGLADGMAVQHLVQTIEKAMACLEPAVVVLDEMDGLCAAMMEGVRSYHTCQPDLCFS